MVKKGKGHGKKKIKYIPNTSIGSKMISVDVASHPASNSFLNDLFREHSITDVNFVVDNAKPRATVPRSVFLQSPNNDRSHKSITRWDSIVRTESVDTLDNWRRNRSRATDSRGPRNSHSLSPSSNVARRKFLGIEDSRTKPSSRRWTAERSASFSAAEGTDKKKIPCLKRSKSSSATSDLPCVLRENFFELVSSDGNLRTSRDRIARVENIFGPLPPPIRQTSDDDVFEGPLNTDDRKPPQRLSLGNVRPDFVQQRSSSDPLLRVPQRKAFLDSEPVAPRRRARRRASIDNVPSRKERSSSKSKSLPSSKMDALMWWNLGASTSRGEDGNGTDATQELTPSPRHNKTLAAATKIIKMASNSVKTSSRKSSRRQSTGSILSPSSKSDRPKRPKSPPLQQPGTPPSMKRGPRSSKKSERAKSPPPQQPGTPPSLKRNHKRRSRRHSDSIIDMDMEVSHKLLHLSQISSPVQPVRRQSFEKQPQPPPPGPPSSDEDEGTMEKARQYTDRSDDKELHRSPVKEVTEDKTTRSKVHFSPKVRYSPKSKRVSFSPKRQHSLPIEGKDPLNENDDDESALLAEFMRRKPFSPRHGPKRAVGGKDGDSNREIIEASLREHSSKSDIMVDFEGGNSSSESFDKKSMLDLLPLAPSLDTPPQTKYTRSQRRSSMPPLAPALEKSPSQKKRKKKTKRSRRRSVI